MCFNKDCESNRKSIKRDDLEGQFEDLLAVIQPTPVMADLLKAMMKKAWSVQREQGASLRRSIRSKIAVTERQITKLLDRIVEAPSNSVVARYETRIAELEREKHILSERAETEGKPIQSFESVFELALRFLSSLCSTWKNGTLEHKRMVLKLAFSRQPCFSRNGGFRTLEIALPFKVLGGIAALLRQWRWVQSGANSSPYFSLISRE